MPCQEFMAGPRYWQIRHSAVAIWPVQSERVENHLMSPYIISNLACMDNLFRSPLIKYRGSWKRGWWVEQIILSTWLLRSIFVQIIVGEHSHGTNTCTIFTHLEKFYKHSISSHLLFIIYPIMYLPSMMVPVKPLVIAHESAEKQTLVISSSG